jgi:hypothetical protein
VESLDKLGSVSVRSLCRQPCPDVKMERAMKQTVNASFCVKLQKPTILTLEMLKTVYDKSPGQSQRSKQC